MYIVYKLLIIDGNVLISSNNSILINLISNLTDMYFYNKHILINYLQILNIVLEKCKLGEPTKPKLTRHAIPNIIHINLSNTKVAYFDISTAWPDHNVSVEVSQSSSSISLFLFFIFYFSCFPLVILDLVCLMVSYGK